MEALIRILHLLTAWSGGWEFNGSLLLRPVR
jgi:hypothetical protein